MESRAGLWIPCSVGALAAAMAVGSCGARTGLPLPPGADAGRDASVDRMPDRAPDGPETPDVGAVDVAPIEAACLRFTRDAEADADAGCTGLACNVQGCVGETPTTISGVTYAPNGSLPLYNVEVFIPNGPLLPVPRGAQCTTQANCCATSSERPITTTLSDATGHFVLTGVPTGDNIPIVVQLGKWRRQAVIPHVDGCTVNTLGDPELTRLPKNQGEGSMPHIALTTGGCDNMGCMLPKIGIDPSEFGFQSDGFSKAVNLYVGDKAPDIPGATHASDLWGDPRLLDTYDIGIFSCECTEALNTKGGSNNSPYFSHVQDYLNKGGRIFTTDFQYVWYKYSPDPNVGGVPAGNTITGLGEIDGGAPSGSNPISIVTTDPKGAALAAWLKRVFPSDPYTRAGKVLPDVVFANIQSLDPTRTVTRAISAYTPGGGGGPPPPTGNDEPRVFTVDMPVASPSTSQCGRGVHIDAHIDQSDGEVVGPDYPKSGCNARFNPGEGMFAFLFFDLASCD